MKILFTTVSAVALVSCFGLGSAFAQTDSSQQMTSEQETAQDQSSGDSQQDRSAGDITCAEITALDTAQVPGMLYYIAGYDKGSQDGQSAGSGESSQSDSTKAGGNASAGGSGDTSQTQASGSNSGGSGSDDASAQSVDSGNESASGGSDDMSQSQSGSANASTGSEASSQVNVVRVAGFYEIPIERTILACGQTPDKRAGDVVREQSQSGGSDTKSGN